MAYVTLFLACAAGVIFMILRIMRIKQAASDIKQGVRARKAAKKQKEEQNENKGC